jgi:Tfp pilus assembly protein PilF
MTRTRAIRNLSYAFIKPFAMVFACCALLTVSACANPDYRKAEDLYKGGRYSEAYAYIEQALKDNPENEEYLKLEVKIKKGVNRKDFLGWDW